MHYKAKRKFGQNFLKDQAYLNQIIEAIPYTQSQMIEIGIGLGDLTDKLLKIHDLIAYEVDNDLCSLLSDKYERLIKDKHFRLICCDVMELKNQTQWLHPKPYFLVSNLPYYIATHIVLRLLRDEMCEGLVVMTQKEVAHKFCAKALQKDFCALSVLAQSVGEVEFLFEVPPSAFEPAPKVTSAVFRILKKGNHLTLDTFKQLESLLKTAFASPRKKLNNNLSHIYPKQKILDAFQSLGLKEHVRPHEVSTLIYHQLLKIL